MSGGASHDNNRQKRLFDWLLIRSGEGRLVAYLSLLSLLVGLGMAVGRSSSDALLFKRVGVEVLPQMFFLISLVLAATSAMYAEFADRVAPGRMFRHVMAILAVFLLVVWYAMAGEGGRLSYVAYFIGYAVASEILLVHLSLYATGFFTATQSKRLFPLINAASRLGAVIGGVTLGLASRHIPLEYAALAWVIFLALTWFLLALRHRGEVDRLLHGAVRKPKPFMGNLREGLHFARHSELLRITGLGLLVMVVLISVQDYLASTILTRHFQDERDLAAFFAWFFAGANLLVLLLQLLATNRLLRRFGLKLVSMIFPWSTTLTFGLLTLSASFIPAVLARFNYIGMMPAFRNPSANLFYNALPNYMQGRARALNIGLILPLGLALAGLMLMWVPRSAVGESLAGAGLVLSLLYVYLKGRKNQVYSATLVRLIRQQVFLSGDGRQGEARLEPTVIREIETELARGPSEEGFLTLADVLIRGAPTEATGILLGYLPNQPLRVQDKLLPRLSALDPEKAAPYLQQCLNSGDSHLRVTALRAIECSDSETAARVGASWLAEENVRLRGEAIRIAFLSGDDEMEKRALEALDNLFASQDMQSHLAALQVVKVLGLERYVEPIRGHLDHRDAVMRAAAICAAGKLLEWEPAFVGRIGAALRDASPKVRRAALEAAENITDSGARMTLLAAALQDEDHGVRHCAIEESGKLMPRTLAEYEAMITRFGAHFRMQGLLARHLSGSGLPGREQGLGRMINEQLAQAWAKKTISAAIPLLAKRDETTAKEAEFLRIVLDEEVFRHIDLALEVLGQLEPNGAASTIRAALASRDPRCRAQGIEAVRHIQNAEIVGRLLPLLEACHDGAGWAHGHKSAPENIASVLSWCEAHGGVWLRQVAATMRGESGLGRTV